MGICACRHGAFFPSKRDILEIADIMMPSLWLEPEDLDLDFDLPWALAGQGILTSLDCTLLVPVPFTDSINLAVNTWSLIGRDSVPSTHYSRSGLYLLSVAEIGDASSRAASWKGAEAMTHVLVWKVYREQRSVWLAMAGLALAGLVLGAIVLDQGSNKSSLIALACGIAYIYGLVVGALLLAGEREGGTAAFLDALPASRLAVWRGKCLGGGLFVLAQVFLLWGLLLVMLPPQDSVFLLPAMLAGCAMLGFGWGLLFSGRTQTPMGAVFAAVLGQAAAMAVMIALGQ